MTWRTLILSGAIVLASAGCQGEGGGGSTSGPSTAGNAAAPTTKSTATATAAVTATATATGANDEPPPAPQPTVAIAPVSTATPGQPGAQPAPALSFSVVPAPGVAKAEDGSGAVVVAQDPVFLDVRGGVGGQALGPELAVGQLRFHDHRYPSPGVVRFTCANKSLLTPGAEVALVYGGKRIVVSASLVVP